MPSATSNKLRLPRDPEVFGTALAHIVIAKGDKDEVLGQAWIAAPNTLITCGHVVDQFARSPASLTVKFPASGNRYVVREIKLHPSFQRQEGDLVKFDVASLIVDLADPESNARPLPVVYEKSITPHQTLSAIRYPSHLGVYTTSLSPLAQIGSYLGPLKRSDRFHLLHDLALAPGDSGTALFDGDSVVAIHCGDTATLPGLNLPTTSIRMSLSVDSLMALGISENSTPQSPNLINLMPAIVTFLLCGVITMAIFAFQYKGQWTYSKSDNLMLNVKFNKPIDQYTLNEQLKVTIRPQSDCFVYVYYTEDQVCLQLYPPPAHKEDIGAKSTGGQQFVIDSFGSHPIQVNDKGQGFFHFVVLNNDRPPVSKDELNRTDPDSYLLPIEASELQKRIVKLKMDDPQNVSHQVIPAPIAKTES